MDIKEFKNLLVGLNSIKNKDIRNMSRDIDLSPEDVKNLRLSLNLTQQELADIFGVSHSYVQKKEINKESKSYRKMSNAESVLLLLMADEHPLFSIVPKALKINLNLIKEDI